MKPLRVLVLMHESLVPPASLKGYTDKEIPLGFGMVDVDDFAGPGGVVSASAGKAGLRSVERTTT